MMRGKPVLFLAFITAAVATLRADDPQRIAISRLGKDYDLVGKLHVPLGKTVVVQGVVVNGPPKGYDGGPNLIIQRIAGEATQEDIRIPLKPYFTKWGEPGLEESFTLPKLASGGSYEMEGYETGGYVGRPMDAYRKAKIELQTTGHYFREELVVFRAEAIKAINFGPADFRGRKAMLDGTAVTKNGVACVEGAAGWVVAVHPDKWVPDVEGKHIETYATYEPVDGDQKFRITDGTWRLVRLQDQVGQPVELRGIAKSLNGIWWFDYRGTELYVEGMKDLPGWSDECHWRPMVIRGTLEKADMPHLDQIGLKSNRDLAPHYVVRKAAWRPIDGLLNVELGKATE